MAEDSDDLTDEEGRFLALLLRTGPAAASDLAKVYEHSPVSTFKGGKDRFRPLIARLERRGLIERLERNGARRAEQLRCSAAAQPALRSWVMATNPSHRLLDDPLRTKVQSFDLLTPDEQIAWVVETRAALAAQLETLDAYQREVTVPFHALVHDNAVRSTRARIAWLDRLLSAVAKPGPPQGSA